MQLIRGTYNARLAVAYVILSCPVVAFDNLFMIQHSSYGDYDETFSNLLC